LHNEGKYKESIAKKNLQARLGARQISIFLERRQSASRHPEFIEGWREPAPLFDELRVTALEICRTPPLLAASRIIS